MFPTRMGVLARFVALVVMVLGGQGLHAEVRLTPPEMLVLGLEMIDQGKPEVALGVTGALLAQDPKNAAVLTLRSRALRDMGQAEPAIETARQAWAVATARREKFGAALAMAQGLASNGNRLAAKFWLSRAVGLAPDEVARRVALQDLAYVRSRSRVSITGGLVLRPSNNVNGGSDARILTYEGIPLTLSPDALPLSGWEAQLTLGATARLLQAETWQFSLMADLQAREIAFSAAARGLAPLVREDDFGSLRLSVGGTIDLQPVNSPTSWNFGLSAFHVDLARKKYSDGVKIHLGNATALPKDRQIVTRATYFATNYASGYRTEVLDAHLGLSMPLAQGHRLDLSLGAEGLRASSGIGRDYVGQRIEVAYDLGKITDAISLRASLGTGWRTFFETRYQPGLRYDRETVLRFEAGLEKVNFFGMTPVLSIGSSITESNVPLYRSRGTFAGLSLRTSF